MTMNKEADGRGDPIDMRLVDGIMYMNMGSMSNDKFVKFDLSDPASLPPEMEGLADQLDPLAAFEEFGAAVEVGHVRRQGGRRRVRTSTTTTLVMDTAKIPSMEDLPAGAGLPDEIAYDAWFDDDFRFRQMQMTMDMAHAGGAERHVLRLG